ncbi:hypothetical protein [Endozoicomonas acroporae]|uniref:hypothetical protein n=1 Tax=Endozoicomonas acroporae TaxID=1701104 RepID=UPI0013D768DB|nr:hypothetical protein [Endozoicomonas acroporae]
MNQAAFSNIELRSYVKAPQSDAESGVRQDDRSCGTRAFKWIVRHPFLTAVATIGLLGAASAGIYGLTLLAASAPAATALSARKVINTTAIGAPSLTAAAPVATSLSTRKVINATAIGSPNHNTTTNQTSAQNNTTKSPTLITAAPVATSLSTQKVTNATATGSPTKNTITKQATTTKAPDITVERVSCCENPDVKPGCCIDDNKNKPLWMCYENGKTEMFKNHTFFGKITPQKFILNCDPSTTKCTRETEVKIEHIGTLPNMDEFCKYYEWGKAKFDDEQCPLCQHSCRLS